MNLFILAFENAIDILRIIFIFFLMTQLFIFYISYSHIIFLIIP